MPTHQDVQKKGSKFLKLPPVRNCFTLAMINKLVVIIISLKVPKIKKKFTIWNGISCTKLQLPPEPLTRGLLPTDPFLSVLCPQLNLLNSPPHPKKISGYATDASRNCAWTVSIRLPSCSKQLHHGSAIGHWHFHTADAWVQSQANVCAIYGEQKGTRTDLTGM